MKSIAEALRTIPPGQSMNLSNVAAHVALSSVINEFGIELFSDRDQKKVFHALGAFSGGRVSKTDFALYLKANSLRKQNRSLRSIIHRGGEVLGWYTNHCSCLVSIDFDSLQQVQTDNASTLNRRIRVF